MLVEQSTRMESGRSHSGTISLVQIVNGLPSDWPALEACRVTSRLRFVGYHSRLDGSITAPPPVQQALDGVPTLPSYLTPGLSSHPRYSRDQIP